MKKRPARASNRIVNPALKMRKSTRIDAHPNNLSQVKLRRCTKVQDSAPDPSCRTLVACAAAPCRISRISSTWQSLLKHILNAGTLVFCILLPSGPGSQNLSCTQCILTRWGNPEWRTEFLATSQRSVPLNFQTWAATEYSSTKGSLVKWICKGSSVERDTGSPRAKNWGNGFLW